MNKNIKIWKCLIVDDEPLAREVISRYIARVPSLQLIGECSNALKAMAFIQQNEVDVLFLDIKMPELLGTELLKILKNPPKVILTTAYQEYALQGYELDVVDYLLKPIKFERFLKAISKVFQLGNFIQPAPAYLPEKNNSFKEMYLYFRTDRKMVKVMLDDILYIEGMGNYVKIHTEKGIIITKNSLVAIEAMLPESLFIKTHRSYIISKPKISSFTPETIEIGNTQIPIGKLFRKNVLNFLAMQGNDLQA